MSETQQSTELGELAAALAKAQGHIRGAAKDSTNPHFKSKYADLAAVWEACRAPLSANGLAVIQTPRLIGEVIVLVTRLVHASGQWVEATYPVWPVQQTPQGFGSALTYARRYSLASVVGVAPDDDDDGNAATERFAQLPPERPQQQARPAPSPKAKAEAPIPDVIDKIPAAIIAKIKALEPIADTAIGEMSVDELELIVTQCREWRPRVKNEHARKWLTAIEATAVPRLRELLGVDE